MVMTSWFIQQTFSGKSNQISLRTVYQPEEKSARFFTMKDRFDSNIFRLGDIQDTRKKVYTCKYMRVFSITIHEGIQKLVLEKARYHQNFTFIFMMMSIK